MFIPHDMKHNVLDFHWSLMSTKSFSKSLTHKINKGIEIVISTMLIEVAIVLNAPVVSDLILSIPLSHFTTRYIDNRLVAKIATVTK